VALKTDFKNDIFEGNRKYKISTDASGQSEIVEVTDFTQEGDAFGADEINTTNKAVNDLLDKMTTLGKSVSDGKTLVAAAITAKKVAATVSDSFATLAEKIGKIVLGSGNAVAADVLKGKTFTNSGGTELTGSMPDHSTKDSLGGINSNYPDVPIHKGTQGQFCTPTASPERLFAIRPDKGYWNGNTYAAAPAESKTVTPLTTQQVVSPASGGVLEKVTVAAIPKQRGTSQKSASCYTYKHTDGVTYLVNWMPAGWYSAWQPTSGTATYAEVWTRQADVASALGLTANKIKKGVTICGITGTWEGYVAGSGDLYNRGALDSSAGFAVVGEVSSGVGTLGYQTTYMLLTKYYGIMLYTGKKYECTGYSKLNFTVSADSSRDDVDWYAVLFTGDAKAGSTYADGILKKTYVGSTNSVTEQTFSVDISDIKTACHIGIVMDSATTGPGYEKGRVFKIWLS